MFMCVFQNELGEHTEHRPVLVGLLRGILFDHNVQIYAGLATSEYLEP